MKDNEILKVKNVSKKFCRHLRRSMLYGTIDLLKGTFGLSTESRFLRPHEFWALNDVNFTVKRGDTLGLIGSNGSGKSTLLRLITGIYPPDQGEISVRGKVGALISLGAGFNPHMTGRENIFINGTILGMSHQEIANKFEEIVAFSDLGEFLDAPVSTYSSGMTVRLGFSIAVHSNADLLIVDEVLAVGDLAFALKCHRKMSEFRNSGGTTILVSHSNQLIRNVCKSALWLDRGVQKLYGNVHDVCNEYEYTLTKDLGAGEKTKRLNYDPQARITQVEFLNQDDRPCDTFEVGSFFKLRIHLDCLRVIHKPIFTITIENLENIVVISNYSHFDGFEFPPIQGKKFIDFNISQMNLKPSKYFLSLTFADGDVNYHLEWHEKAHAFSVKGGPVSYGIFNPHPEWQLKDSSRKA